MEGFGIGMKDVIEFIYRFAVIALLYAFAFNNGCRYERKKHKGKDIG